MKTLKSFSNWLSITGFILVVNSLVLILFLFLIVLFSEETNVYLGIYIYIVLPGFLVLGLILIPIGMYIKLRKLKKGIDTDKLWPMLDMNLKRTRATIVRVSILTFIFLIVSAMGSYQAFRFTESVEFCGKLCHRVMEPEYVTYQNSPHARVPCVDCHVGEGADWYVKSKLSGLYQVYATVLDKYPCPIPTPIKDLRPARETCEKCHWPQKFYARKLRSQRSFLADSSNTEWDISLLMKIGPSYSALGLIEGIHWHINPDIKIEYVSDVPERESIPWVRYTNLKTGEVKIFTDEENPMEQRVLDTLPVRTMDCMDCHNRPSHLYKTAPDYVDNLMLTGAIPKDIPFIKRAAMESLMNPFTDKDTALLSIRDIIYSYYSDNAPDILAANKGVIDLAIGAIREEYLKNSFPSMRADATCYLDHIGHLQSNGCFRCHSDRHKTEQGFYISKDCNMCHTIIAQGPAQAMSYTSINDTLEFIHPVPLKNDIWKTSFCSDCHKSLFE